jgi:N-acetyl-gamma-glutamyl-phosphate reductase
MAYSASVLGASGYSGAELVRLLAAHPSIRPVALAAGAWAGAEAEAALPHLVGASLPALAPLEEAAGTSVDVCFSCLPSGKLAETLPAVRAELVVDLSDDHRADGSWTYGLTEFAREEVARAKRIANPGCYPTAVLLATVPFAQEGLIQAPLIVDAMSGVTGAGRRIEDRLLFGTVDGSVAAYGTVEHRHIPEMERALGSFGGAEMTVSFTPHLVPLSRGLLATVRGRLTRDVPDTDAIEVLASAYAGERFVRVVEGWPGTKAVAGSNGAIVSARVDARTGFLIAACAIDNLGKGAAGQAIQNANLALGLDEHLGLEPFGVWP